MAYSQSRLIYRVHDVFSWLARSIPYILIVAVVLPQH